MVNVKDAVDERDVYTPPCVVKISDIKRGEGQHACQTGSGDTEYCYPGNSALNCCDKNGNSATGICNNNGAGNID